MEVERQAPRKIFWGWYVVAAAFITIGINYGTRYSFGVFLKPMCEDLGWPRSIVSFAMSLALLFYGIGGILSGRLLDRFAPRWIMMAGSAIAAFGFILTPFISTPLQLYMVYGVIYGLGASFFGSAVCVSSVGKWFIQKRGIAIGITSIGIGVGTMAITPLAGLIVKFFDWKAGFIILGIATFVLCTAMSQFFMGRTRPEEYGLLPDGTATLPAKPEKSSDGYTRSYRQTTRLLLTDSRFWIIAVCFGFVTMTAMTVLVHQVAYAEGYGINRIAAASSLGIIGMASIAGRFFFGWLSDKIGDAKHSACLGFACMTVAMIILLFFHSIELFYLYACLFGFGYGSISPMLPILMMDRFGRDISGTSYGLIAFFAIGLGGSLGPILGGIIYDATGSYTFAWQINLAVLMVVTVLIQFLKTAHIPETIQRQAD
ncbi:MAG: MFS transporter [Deltaproteobacteria bacterium]|nr:MFS transporter [Deltaproteobacteria bacterium]